ncbi:MAG: ribbon-helix-helix protein, CopG family [Rhodospirillales bacterium]|nr:ribbon-helix-helix protein, CopG family [Rhodospirillales bacterium]
MPKTIAMNVRLPKAVWDKLDALAKSTRRSKSCLAAEAIAAYVEANAWQVALIEQRVAEAEAGSRTVSHDDVAKWVASWGQGIEAPTTTRPA